MDKRSGQEIFSKEYRSRFVCFIGVDLHKETVTLVAVDPDQMPIGRLKISTKCVEKIEAWIAALPKPCWMAVEAVGFAEWFIDRFRERVDRIDIADATELANRRGTRRKNDPNDALDCAMRLAVGDCPLGWIADPELMRLRKLGRHWRRLSRTMSRAKHGMRSILNATNLRGPKFDGAGAHRWILAHGDRLKDVDRETFGDLIEIVELIERQRQPLRREIIFANRQPQFVETVDRLKTIPGIDEIWACIIAAEVGPFERFPNADALEYWAGVTPDNKESAGRTQSGHITKAGSATLRWALGQAGVCLCHHDGRQEKVRQRLLQRRGRSIANTAMGRRLVRTTYAMMRDKKPYQNAEPTNHLAKANAARLRKQRIRTTVPTQTAITPVAEVLKIDSGGGAPRPPLPVPAGVREACAAQ